MAWIRGYVLSSISFENTKKDVGFNVPTIYWNYTTKKILTLDKVDGTSIREHQKLKDQINSCVIEGQIN